MKGIIGDEPISLLVVDLLLQDIASPLLEHTVGGGIISLLVIVLLVQHIASPLMEHTDSCLRETVRAKSLLG